MVIILTASNNRYEHFHKPTINFRKNLKKKHFRVNAHFSTETTEELTMLLVYEDSHREHLSFLSGLEPEGIYK